MVLTAKYSGNVAAKLHVSRLLMLLLFGINYADLVVIPVSAGISSQDAVYFKDVIQKYIFDITLIIFSYQE